QYGDKAEEENQSQDQPRRGVSEGAGVPDAETLLHEDGGGGWVAIEEAKLPALVGRAIAATTDGAIDADDAPQKRHGEGDKGEGNECGRQVAERAVRVQASERDSGEEERHPPDRRAQELQH